MSKILVLYSPIKEQGEVHKGNKGIRNNRWSFFKRTYGKLVFEGDTVYLQHLYKHDVFSQGVKNAHVFVSLWELAGIVSKDRALVTYYRLSTCCSLDLEYAT